MNQLGIEKIERLFFAADGMDGGDDEESRDYLSRLAKSILQKDKARARPTVAPPPPGPGREPSRPQHTPLPTQGRPNNSSTEIRRPDTQVNAAPILKEWVRKVDIYDENGKFLPGTILVFEDGHMGIFKETNAAKDYDIVYQLSTNGKATPHGMPLYTYHVEPVGRLTQALLEQVVQTGRWERDMIVFHLLKYKDRVHVPEIVESGSGDQVSLGSSESVSTWAVRKLDASQLAEQPEQPAKPALTRGRRLTIEFGPTQKWESVYWGKDELGHVVAHHTHDAWSLMHLDLGRFKECTVVGDLVSDDQLRVMERDFADR